MTDQIAIRGARLHNLKAITLSIPKNRLVVLTGLSGSGKSTLAFDILRLLAEGTPKDIAASAGPLTGQYLRRPA